MNGVRVGSSKDLVTVTDELRRMLDERGVEWRGGLPTETMVEADGLDLLYVALPDGRVQAFIRNYLTPEQAIAATLGRGECRIERRQSAWGGFTEHCSECGADLGCDTRNTQKFCPNCGRRVEQ